MKKTRFFFHQDKIKQMWLMGVIRIGTISCLCTSTSSRKKKILITISVMYQNVQWHKQIICLQSSMRKKDFSKASQSCKHIAEHWLLSMMNFLMVASLLVIKPQKKTFLREWGNCTGVQGVERSQHENGWEQPFYASYWGKNQTCTQRLCIQ